MLLTNPYYSLLDFHIKNTKELFRDYKVKCEYTSYDKEKDNYVFFTCFNLKQESRLDDVIIKEIKYEGSLNFNFNKATNEVYVTKVPYVFYGNTRIPIFTSDVAQIIVNKLQKYVPNTEIKITFSNPLVPLAEDENVLSLLPSLANTKNHQNLIYILNGIKKEKTKIAKEIERYKEQQAKKERSKEIAISQKRKILGLDPKDFPSVEEFQKRLTEKLLDLWNKKVKNIERHLEANIQKYKSMLAKGNARNFLLMLGIVLLDEIKEHGYTNSIINSLYEEYLSEYEGYWRKYEISDFKCFLKKNNYISPKIKEIAELCQYFSNNMLKDDTELDEDEDEVNAVTELDEDRVNAAMDIILEADLSSPTGLLSILNQTRQCDDFKLQAHDYGYSYSQYSPFILDATFLIEDYKWAKFHPAYKDYYETIRHLWEYYGHDYFDVADTMNRKKIIILPIEIIMQISKLQAQLSYYNGLLANPQEAVLKFYKTSKIWGSIIQLPYWSRIYNDVVYGQNVRTYHEVFNLFMIKPGVESIDFDNIINFIENPRFKGNVFGKQMVQGKNLDFYDRLIITIPSSLPYEQILKLVDYAHTHGDKINFVCENFDVAMIVKRFLIGKAVNAYAHDEKYFNDWCFVNIDPDYYKSFLINTPGNKQFWHRYDYSSDYNYRRKELLSLDRIIELAILYSQNKTGKIDYQLLDTLLLGSYNSETSFLEDVKAFEDIVENETTEWEEELITDIENYTEKLCIT